MRHHAVIGADRREADGAGLRGPYWLFSAPVDLAAFLGSAAVAWLALAVGVAKGWLHADTPEWGWIGAILLVDVAHVYATGLRVYFDPDEFRRRKSLYVLTPILAYLLAAALYSEGERLFWRGLAYLAVLHFIRQQYGWVALYRAKANERDRLGYWIDAAAIYLSTLYPLLYWHTRLPRNFHWFLEDDFAPLPRLAATVVEPVYWGALALYFANSLYRLAVHRFWNPGKDLVVATTAVCWYVGIVTFNSDYAFTMTNVIIHGVPYLVLVYWHRYHRPESNSRSAGSSTSAAGKVAWFLSTVWLLAFLEEMVWDRGLWRQRSWLFGSPWELGQLEFALVPLLAVPQITHYVLDGFIWKRRSNPAFSQWVAGRKAEGK
jgi:hypothetical protein